MHGPKGENRERSRHMWSVPSHGTTTLAVDSKSYSANSFFKDVRKISVGDCALFKPPHDSPPFIGIIRWLKLDNENYPKLGVNWLYRPAEVKLGRGAVLEAAPNEVFYSFHRDEIPAASLLHPCKVAFLPKGVELLSGVSSFVCRRVYDTTNKCLWWLTDQDYINDRQGEVDKLLSKTRLEMHGTVQQQQQDCRSPKPMNGPTSTSHLKHSPDSVQNSTGSFPSQSKGKKKERNDQVSVPLKRECSSRANDGDVGNLISESLLNSEIAKLTERGGLVDFEGVERLVQLMRPEKSDWKMDLRSRSLLAGVIASTDSLDCLSQFVQLRGLLVLDEWIQEVHKGRVGDSSSPKDSDRSAEDFLLVLLRALDKLPVNLNALQMCNIGKSVNNLRSYRNSEIQKKARSLVDTWKKRVEAEMTISDAKTSSGQPVTWPSRGKHEVSHGASRQTGGSSDAGIRSSYTQNSSKSASVKLAQGEANAKSSYASLGAVKPSLLASQCANIRDGQPRMPVIGGHSDPSQTAVREEKSSSSCSSDHGRNLVPSAKEDARSSTAGSASTSKITGSASKYRRSPNSLRGASTSCVQREAISTISSSLAKISASEKLSQSPVTCEKSADAPVSSHKLIVKIPSRGRSPAQSVTGGSVDDPIFTNSRASSPVPSEKNDQAYHNSKEKSDAYRSVITSDMNTESWQSNDLKDIGSDEGDGSPAAAPDCERSHTGDDMAKVTAIPKAASLSSENEMKSRKLHDSSFSSINALIESCEKYAEATEPLLICDDVGMNLLASVAAGEIPKSGMASPIDSSPATANEACMDYNGTSQDNDDDPGGHSSTSGKDLPQNGDPFVRSNEKSDVLVGASTMPVSSTCTVQKTGGVDKDEKYPEKESLRDESHDLAPYRQNVGNNLAPETEDDSAPREQLQSSFLLEKVDDEKKKYENQGRSSDALMEQEPFDLQSFSESMNRNVGAVENLPSENFNNLKAEDTDCDDVVACNHVDQEGNRTQQESMASPTSQKVEESSRGFAGTDQKDTGNNENLYSKETIGHGVGASVSYQDSTTFATENEPSTKSKGLNMENIEGTDAMGRVLTAGDAIVLPVDSSDKYGKLKFDLNEGVNVEDGKCAESVNISAPGFPASVCLIGSMPSFSVFSASVGMPASVTVAAAAKGPFVPPEDLLRNKGEVGWKGSAATSAFRPAEPRKAIEIALVTANTPHPDATAACKQARPRLDIDLNVADERMLDDISCQFSAPGKSGLKNDGHMTGSPMGTASFRCSGGLDLDLNRVDEVPEVGQPPLLRTKYLASTKRNFDLNNGPAVDEAIAESSSYNQQHRANFPVQPPIRIDNIEIGNLSSWYPPWSTYSAVPISSLLSDRGEQPFPFVGTSGSAHRILGGAAGSTPLNLDPCRGTVLSSAAVPFPSTPYQYPIFPFGTSFPVPSSSFSSASSAYVDMSSGGRLCVPAVPSQLLGTATAVSSQYPRPYVVSLPDISGNIGVDGSNKFRKQSLDLNAGPGVHDVERRAEAAPIMSRRVPGANTLPLAEEQSRMYRVVDSVLKRKEPEGGWDADRLSCKQASWQ